MIDRESILSQMEEALRLCGFAESTRSNYRRYAGKFLMYGEERGGGMCEETIRAFPGYLLDERKLTPGTVNMYNAAIRLPFEVTPDQAVNHKRVPRPWERKGLPEILTKEELRRILSTPRLFGTALCR